MFSYTSGSKTNTDLINQLQKSGIIKSNEVAEVMKMVDRADYCPSSPYDDCPIYLGYGATISAPHMHAFALV